MAYEDWLQTLAEIAVALAGFSGLLAGMNQRSARASRINATRLRTIVETSLSVLFFCLVPIFLDGFGVEERGNFRISALLYLFGFTPLTVMGFRRFMVAADFSKSRIRSPIAGANLVASLIAFGAAFACVLGRPSHAVPTLYLMALTGTLAIGALNFLGYAMAYSESEAQLAETLDAEIDSKD